MNEVFRIFQSSGEPADVLPAEASAQTSERTVYLTRGPDLAAARTALEGFLAWHAEKFPDTAVAGLPSCLAWIVRPTLTFGRTASAAPAASAFWCERASPRRAQGMNR